MAVMNKVLVLAANTVDMSELHLKNEVREIENSLLRTRKRKKFQLHQIWSPTYTELRRVMFDIKPSIVHFCGHGTKDEGIALVDESGFAKFVSPEALSEFFHFFSEHIECVILNACHSDSQAEAIAQYISYVVGSQSQIGNDAAKEFSSAFYDSLSAEKSYEEAYKIACNAIKLKALKDASMPKMYARSLDSVAIDSSSTSLQVHAQWVLVVSGTVSDANKPMVDALLKHLQKILNTSDLSLQKIESGSIRFHFESSSPDYEKAIELLRGGDLNELLGIHVESIEFKQYVLNFIIVPSFTTMTSNDSFGKLLEAALQKGNPQGRASTPHLSRYYADGSGNPLRAIQDQSVDSLSVVELQLQHQQNPQYFFELFVRAFRDGDDAVYQQLLRVYQALVIHWAKRHSLFTAIQTERDEITHYVFYEMWRSRHGERFTFDSLPAILGYLRDCINAALLEMYRDFIITSKEFTMDTSVTSDSVLEGTPDFELLWQRICILLPEPHLQNLVWYSFVQGYKPEALQAEFPEVYPNEESIRVLKQKALRRLRKDPGLCQWFGIPADEI